ncbi:putative N6-adenine methyltransferase-domain-containing protein [Xylariales sp. AK1849]|nr:putative N6-adenine methyltransferase-domain-containing protein [Xylariales sp. AK1849]
MADSDDEPITLSLHALDALRDFYSDRDAHTERLEKLKAEAEADSNSGTPLSMDAFKEDWQESQFWYSDETATLLAKQLLRGATNDTTIAAVSAPSVFVALKNLLNAAAPDEPKPKVHLLEHDQRFAVFPEFVFYDYNSPTKLPGHLIGTVDRLIIDPPFLNPDCQTKMAMTARWLTGTNPETPAKVILVTGERTEHLVLKLYKPFGLRTTTYDVVHVGLKNEFYCYASFDSEAWKWKES